MKRVLVYGDPHLSSKNHGSHRDYPKESLEYYTKTMDLAVDNNADIVISLGDFTFGRFGDLGYRLKVEEQLERVKGKHYMLKGNHDVMTDGITEYEYYLSRNEFYPAQKLDVNGFKIQMFNWGDEIKFDSDTSIAMVHDYVRFTHTQLPMYGTKYVNLDDIEIPDSLQYILAGHIHGQHIFGKGNTDARPIVHYLGCNARPSYIHGMMPENGQVVILDFMNEAYGDAETKIEYNVMEILLWSLDESFNLEAIAAKDADKLDKANRVDLTEIVEELNRHERVSGDPLVIIDSLQVDEAYKNKAKEYLMKAL